MCFSNAKGMRDLLNENSAQDRSYTFSSKRTFSQSDILSSTQRNTVVLSHSLNDGNEPMH